MKKIPMTQGKFALVDDENYEEVMEDKWHPQKKSNTTYATRSSRKGKRKCTRMHRLIMNAPDGMDVDHKDGNGLNNQKSNLRICTHQQNGYNQKKRSDNKSGMKGVYWDNGRRRWRSQICIDGKKRQLGRFFCLMKAVRTYDRAAIENFGEFANVNFPKEIAI